MAVRLFPLRFYLCCVLASISCAFMSACEEGPREAHETSARGQAAGDPRLGQKLMAQYQCTACHAIPDVAGPFGGMGPTLARFGRRSYIAGHIPNDARQLSAWLRSPQALVPGTAMPDLGVSEADASDMAAYLLSLR
jgi:cytochrome c